MAAAMLLLTLPLFAQGPRRFAAGRGDELRSLSAGYMAGYLNLTDAQKTQAEAIFSAARTAAAPVRGQLTSAREALQAAVKARKTDAEIDALSAPIGSLTAQLTAIQAKAMVKFRAILTPEQITKLDSREGRRGPRFGE